MTANWFEAKVKYVKVGEDGKEKKMSELYLLDAMSYTEAESRITENLRVIATFALNHLSSFPSFDSTNSVMFDFFNPTI